jgi:hypothetical protein
MVLPLVLGASAMSPASGPSQAVTCRNLDRAAADRKMIHRDWVRGDVTGDGRADTVAIVEDKSAGLGCRYGVIFLSGGHSYVFPLGRGFILKPGDVIGQPWPLIRLLARVDDHAGAEVLVALGHGASFEQGELLTLRGGKLRQIRLPQGEGSFSYGAIVPTGTNFDCVKRDSGLIVRASYSADAQGSRWRYRLDFFRLVGLRLDLTKVQSIVVRANIAMHHYPQPPRWWTRYKAELNPFRHCVIARHGPPT